MQTATANTVCDWKVMRNPRFWLAKCQIIGAVLLFLSSPGAVTAAAQTPAQQLASARQAYLSGNLTQSQAILLGLAGGNMAPREKLKARLELAALCEEIGDFSCFETNLSEMVKLRALLPAGEQGGAAVEIQPWIARFGVWTGRAAAFNVADSIETLNRIPDNGLTPRSFLMLQTAAFLHAIDRNDRINARIAVSRLLVRTLTLPNDAEMLARYAATSIRFFRVLHDDYNALRYFLTFDDFLRTTLLKTTPAYISYLENSAALQADRGIRQSLDDAVLRITEAKTLLRSIKAPARFRDEALAQASVAHTLFEILRNDAATAAKAHNENPFQTDRRRLQAQATFRSMQEVYFAVLDIFVARLRKTLPDVKWQDILLKSDIAKLSLENFEPFQAYRTFGAALLAGPDSKYWRSLLLSAAADDIRQYESNLFAGTRAFPLPNYIDREIAGLALRMLARDGTVDAASAEIAITGTGFLQRNIRSKRGDDLYRLHRARSEPDISRNRAWLFVSDAQRDLEYDALKTRIGMLQTQKISARTVADIREGLVRTANNQTMLLRDGPVPDGRLPRLGDIQPLLSDGEAFVAEAAHGGTLFKLCVTRSGWRFIAEAIPETTGGDLRILRAALSAGHAPSEKLDSQYPAHAAVALGKLALGGLDSCIENAHKIVFSAAPFMADIPLAALLDDMPPRDGDGFDLTHAKWLLHKYDFSYVTSMEEFVAVRRMAQRPHRTDRSFLGVGDPVLSVKGQGGTVLPERMTQLSELDELPETGIELRNIAKDFPASRVLTRRDATEADFKKAEPGRYAVIEFATHGLMGGELDGILEPGLVLTPNPVGDFKDDGFLSTTEIAALKLNARLVVLSACNTANFEIARYAINIRGLTASFAMAGVPTAVASLWPVESQTSQRLMIGFFDQLRTGKDRSSAGAMSATMRGFIAKPPSKAFLHPRFWAPFSVYGDGNMTLN